MSKLQHFPDLKYDQADCSSVTLTAFAFSNDNG